jgi:hypothetical protein
MTEFNSAVKEGNSFQVRLATAHGSGMGEGQLDDEPKPAWAERLIAKARALGWPETRRASILAERSGIDVSSCRKYFSGTVAQPRGKRLEKVAKAIEMTEGELLGLVGSTSEDRVNHTRQFDDGVKHSLIDSDPPSKGGAAPLAKMEEKVDRQIAELWRHIGRLEERLARLEAPPSRPDEATRPTHAR